MIEINVLHPKAIAVYSDFERSLYLCGIAWPNHTCKLIKIEVRRGVTTMSYDHKFTFDRVRKAHDWIYAR